MEKYLIVPWCEHISIFSTAFTVKNKKIVHISVAGTAAGPPGGDCAGRPCVCGSEINWVAYSQRKMMSVCVVFPWNLRGEYVVSCDFFTINVLQLFVWLTCFNVKAQLIQLWSVNPITSDLRHKHWVKLCLLLTEVVDVRWSFCFMNEALHS